MEEAQKKFFPKGEPTEPFDKDAKGTFQADLYNLALDKDVAKKRNVIYLVIILVCIVLTLVINMTSSFKTYVVRVNDATGQVEAGGELKATNYSPQEAELKHFLYQFILDTRTVPLDPVQFNLSHENAKYFLTPEAAKKMQEMTGKDSPVSKLGHMTVQPEIKSIQLQPGSKNTYQVRWVEDEFGIGGNSAGKKSTYVALFAIQIGAKTTKEEDLLKNPLGFKIYDLSINKETESR